MKIDKNKTRLLYCPNTKKVISVGAYRKGGACKHCGNNSRGRFLHAKSVWGHWERPNVLERLFYGYKPRFRIDESGVFLDESYVYTEIVHYAD